MASTDKFLGIEKFFVLQPGFPGGSKHGYWLQPAGIDALDADTQAIARGDAFTKTPYTMKITEGKNFADIFSNSSSLFIVSERLKQLFYKHELKGWNEFQIKILDKNGEKIKPRYFGISILGRGGRLDKQKSRYKGFEFKGGIIPKEIHGVYFSLKDWDGSDFFFIKDFGEILITQKVADLLRDAKATGYCARSAKEYEIVFPNS